MKHIFSTLTLLAAISISPVWAQTAPVAVQTTVQAEQGSSAAKVNFSPIFISLSDAMGAVKNGDNAKAAADLAAVQTALTALNLDANQPAVQAVNDALTAAKTSPTDANLSVLSSALYTLEKQLNPVDYTDKRKQFTKNVMPAFDEFSQVLLAADTANPQSVTDSRAAYDKFNRIWVANERVVRNSSKGHYGQIETAMALVRVSIESTPVNHAQIVSQLGVIKQQLDSFNAGQTASVQPTDDYQLKDGVQLLKDGLAAFQANDTAAGQAKIGEFISRWMSIEGAVSTRNPALYSRVESQLPVIMANGTDAANQAKLTALIDELTAIDPTAAYSAVDAMLILLREGLEALLIIIALLSALTAAGQARGKKWVYAGVAGGLAASIAGAVALQKLFPQLNATGGREVMEGIIGIMAVVLMLGIGAWLHSKSSVKSWNAFIKRHMGQTLSTGSFMGLFGLAFLSVFREGAETILFYVGILPNISTASFLLGIGAALAILAVVAWMMIKTSAKLPIPKLFAALTWLIYALGFKILGISLAALQLTGYVSRTVVPTLPAVTWAGFYPTVETMSAHAIYVLLVVAVVLYQRRAAA